MNFKDLMAAVGLDPRYFSLLPLSFVFETWLRIRGKHITFWDSDCFICLAGRCGGIVPRY